MSTEPQIRLMSLPEMECVSAAHRGSQETISSSLDDLKRYFAQNHLEFNSSRREIYLGLDVANNTVTEIQIPIKLGGKYGK